MEKKIRITKGMSLEALMANVRGEALPYGLTSALLEEFLEKELETVRKKNAKNAAEAEKKRAEDETRREEVLGYLSDIGDAATCTQIANALGLSSNQRAQALLRPLVADGKVKRQVSKGTAYFSLA